VSVLPFPPPRWATPRDPDAPTYGGAVATLAEALGTPLMPWQRYVADVGLELDEDGLFRYDQVIVSVPRQAGKTTLVRPVMVHRALIVPGGGSAWMTAQTRNDIRDTWLATAKVMENSPLRKKLTIRRSNGSEGITFKAGGEIRIFAPSEDALHGKTTDLTFLDEIWAFTQLQGSTLMQAVLPTMVTRPWAQTWMVSTAGTAKSTFMLPIVKAARKAIEAGDRTTRTAYFEWSLPDDADPMDLDAVVAAHPAFGHTIRNRRVLAFNPMLMKPAEYARAYGNVWVSADDYYIAPAVWARGRTFEAFTAESPVAFSVEANPDRSGAVIVAAGLTSDGTAAVEIVEHRAGLSWIVGRIIELVRRHRPVAVTIDPYGPARPVWAALREQRHTQVPLSDPFSAADLVQADTELVSGLLDGTVAHRSHERLDAALSAATSRTVNGMSVIARTGDPEEGYPAALVAAMLAHYGLRHPPETVPRPAVRTGERSAG
jgi:hypothetical protein